MFTTFTTALSGLNAASAAVDIVGNNLANLNTVGYKTNNVQFADLMSQQAGLSSSLMQTGFGVSSAQAVRQFTQGSLQTTTGGLNAGIQGAGFFVVKGADGQSLYTRAGNFKMDSTGHILTASGETVQGWGMTNGVLNTNGAAGDLVIPVDGVVPAITTTSMNMTVNLNAAGVVDEKSGSYSAPMQVVDSLGGVHTLTVTFTKTDSNAWSYDVTIPDEDVGIAPSVPPVAPTPITSGTLTFDNNGVLTSPAAADAPVEISISGLANGAADMKVNWSMFKNGQGLLTQFVQPSGISASDQDGVPAGQISGVGIADGGIIVASFTNGKQLAVGQLALASIKNPDTLASVGNNNLQATNDTATPAVGTALSGGRGQIKGSSLESSNVDIATEFTNLITFQRSYQANSKVISTTDTMMQDVINLVR